MASKDPRHPEFWKAEDVKLAEQLAPLIMRIIVSGGQEGEEILPPKLRVLIDWDKFNSRAVDWINRYKLDWLYGINDTTRKQVQSIISDWVSSGENVTALEAQLSPTFGEQRAGRIAVTEVTRAYAEGNSAAWQATGLVEGRKWNTGQDELVCPICGGLAGQVAPFGYPFVHPDTREVYDNPPAHVNCLPGDTNVLPIGSVSAGSKRWYKGDVVTIRTLKSNLTVTPNHPVLTLRGWIPASEVRHSDHVAECAIYGGRDSPVNLQKNNVVSSIKDIFGSLNFAGFRVPTTAPDFHGDGANSNVAIVRADLRVVNRIKPNISQSVCYSDFVPTDIAEFAVPAFRASNKFVERRRSAADSFVGRGNLLFPCECAHRSPLDGLGLRLVPWGDTVVDQMTPDNSPANADFVSNGIFGHPGLIKFSVVTEVSNNNFSGHVYNLQTESGLFVAANIITHNCRCFLTPVLKSTGEFEERLLEELS